MALTYINYLAVPHREGGRDFSGVDCFGLICLFYREEFGIELTDSVPYEKDWYKDNPLLIIKSAKAAGFKRVKESPRHGDVVVLNEEGALKHLAVYLKQGYLLHNINTGTYCESVTKGLGRKIRAVYRYTEGVPACV